MLSLEMPDPCLLLAFAVGDLLHCPAGDDAGDVLVDEDSRRLRQADLVRFLDEQPVSRFSPSRGRMRTSAQPPSFGCHCSLKESLPFFKAFDGSFLRLPPPVSQSITVPPPYSPFGIVSFEIAIGKRVVFGTHARRLSSGLRLGRGSPPSSSAHPPIPGGSRNAGGSQRAFGPETASCCPRCAEPTAPLVRWSAC